MSEETHVTTPIKGKREASIEEEKELLGLPKLNDAGLQRARDRFRSLSLTLLQSSVKELVANSILVLKEGRSLTEKDRLALSLCDAVEKCLYFGYKQSISSSLFGSLSSFWPHILHVCEEEEAPRGVRQDVMMIDNIHGLNIQSKASAFIRHCLNEGCIADYCRMLFALTHTDPSYESFSVVRDLEDIELFVSILDALTHIKFEMRLNDMSLLQRHFNWV